MSGDFLDDINDESAAAAAVARPCLVVPGMAASSEDFERDYPVRQTPTEMIWEEANMHGEMIATVEQYQAGPLTKSMEQVE